ncbi:Tol biopolymer transport system, TolR protein [Vibrio chagasii]|nr:Tol biopolymer transport system, TolR protein [Vibrio chagasii]
MRIDFSAYDIKPEMNFIPLIDVMLVLLVVFMATTPTINSNIQIDVPQVSSESVSSEDPMTPKTLIVSMDEGRQLYVTNPHLGLIDEPKTAQEISVFTAAVLREEPNTKVFLRSSGSTSYQNVADVLNLLKGSGAESINLVTIGENNDG